MTAFLKSHQTLKSIFKRRQRKREPNVQITKRHENATTDKLNMNPPLIRQVCRRLEVVCSLPRMTSSRFWPIVLLKVAYYASSTAPNFVELCQKLSQSSQIMLLVSKNVLTKWQRFCVYNSEKIIQK